jgi:3-oxoacid CoA-transferase
MGKKIVSADEAVADIRPKSSIAIAGFGVSHRFPSSLIQAVHASGVKDLCLVCNSPGGLGPATAQELIAAGQISKLIACFSARPGMESPAERAIAEGRMELELVPQGTLVERMRAGGAGIAGVYTRAGVGTPIAEGKEVRSFDGSDYVLERAITVDYALIRAERADRAGNVQFRGGSQNFNVSFAKAARTTIAEVGEIVEVGELAPQDVDLPGVFVDRLVIRAPDRGPAPPAPSAKRRPSDSAREYHGKRALARRDMARKAALLLPEPAYVNLGVGLPTLVSNYLQGRDIMLHAENGILGYAEQAEGDSVDLDVYNAGGEFVTLRSGAAFFDSVTSFEMARSGRLDAVILGAYQVDEDGNLANWATPSMTGGGIGGAMDLVAGNSTLMIITEHHDSKGGAKLVSRCTYPVTGVGCVDIVVTDLAVLRRGPGGFVLEEVAPGFSPEEVVDLTDMRIRISDEVITMTL